MRTNGGSVRGEAAFGNVWSQRPKTVSEKEEKAWGKKRDLVIFVAGVINATAEVKS